MAEAIDDGMDEPSTQMVVCCGRPRHPGGQVVADVHEQVEVRLAPVAVLDAAQDLLQPAAALATRRALAARLAPEEAGDPPGGPHHAGGVVHDHDRARAEHGPGLAHLVLAERQVEVVGAEPRGRHPAGDDGLQLAAAGDAPAEHRGVDEVAEGGLHHLDLVDTGVAHVPGQREQPRARGAARAQGGEGARTRCTMTQGRLDSVSTLFTTVGSP